MGNLGTAISSERNRKLYQVAKALEGLSFISPCDWVVLSQDALTKTVPFNETRPKGIRRLQEADWMLCTVYVQAVEKVGLLKMDLPG